MPTSSPAQRLSIPTPRVASCPLTARQHFATSLRMMSRIPRVVAQVKSLDLVVFIISLRRSSALLLNPVQDGSDGSHTKSMIRTSLFVMPYKVRQAEDCDYVFLFVLFVSHSFRITKQKLSTKLQVFTSMYVPKEVISNLCLVACGDFEFSKIL